MVRFMPGSAQCERCAGPTEYFGRISLPATMIHRCKHCVHDTWMADAPPARNRLPDQPQVQQQQQPQAKESPKVRN